MSGEAVSGVSCLLHPSSLPSRLCSAWTLPKVTLVPWWGWHLSPTRWGCLQDGAPGWDLSPTRWGCLQDGLLSGAWDTCALLGHLSTPPLQVHIHLDAGHRRTAQRSDVWNTTAARKPGMAPRGQGHAPPELGWRLVQLWAPGRLSVQPYLGATHLSSESPNREARVPRGWAPGPQHPLWSLLSLLGQAGLGQYGPGSASILPTEGRSHPKGWKSFSGSLLEVSLLACDVAVIPESQCQHPRLLFPSRSVEHGGQRGMSVLQASVVASCLLGLWAQAPPSSAVPPGG